MLSEDVINRMWKTESGVALSANSAVRRRVPIKRCKYVRRWRRLKPPSNDSNALSAQSELLFPQSHITGVLISP